MSRVFIIGMPVWLRARFAQAAQPHGIEVTSVLADVGRQGGLQLRPFPGQAVADLATYLNALPNWADACVVILPYTEPPPALDELIEMVLEADGEVIEPEQGEDSWPVLSWRKSPDAAFNDALFARLSSELFPSQGAVVVPLPSDSLREAVRKHQCLLVADGVFDVCDEVALIRHKFVADTLNAFVHYLEQGGQVGRIDAFFGGRGLIHAQSGGSLIKVEVHNGEKPKRVMRVHTHMKQGDATSPQAAARIYYCIFKEDDVQYLAVLYVGPHPDEDQEFTRKVYIPTGD
ncbi:hypothetical protein CSQ96_06610 [Janthinobacterium sp. BJB412]|nr:hypothetical protein CSQ96_06610 [Janthinobacterium sp. BJB412]